MNTPEEVKIRVIQCAKKGMTAKAIYQQLKKEFPDDGLHQLAEWLDEIIEQGSY